MLEQKNGRLVRRYDGEILSVEPWGENALRVRVTMEAELPPEDWALLPPDASQAEGLTE